MAKNVDLDEWINRLAGKTYAALLMLIEGGHTLKHIESVTKVRESHVCRLRKNYERLSGTRLIRSKT